MLNYFILSFTYILVGNNIFWGHCHPRLLLDMSLHEACIVVDS